MSPKQKSAAPPKPVDVQSEPVSNMQLNQLQIEWVPHNSIHPNNYNPNTMTWHDRMLLRQSLLEDGWTQPIVTLPDHTIVDGEQRWTVAGLELHPKDIQEVMDRMEVRRSLGHPESESVLSRLHLSKERLEAAIAQGLPATIASITGGLVPITTLDLGDDAHKILSTIRHNRARGTHGVDAMAALTQDLAQLGLDVDELETRLGMTNEEISRFMDITKEAEKLLDGLPDYANAWEPTSLANADQEFRDRLQLSADANSAFADHEQAVAARKREIDERLKAQIENAQAEGQNPTQIDKDKLRKQIENQLSSPADVPPPVMVKINLFITKEESEIVSQVLGVRQARNLVKLCQIYIQHKKKLPKLEEETDDQST